MRLFEHPVYHELLWRWVFLKIHQTCQFEQLHLPRYNTDNFSVLVPHWWIILSFSCDRHNVSHLVVWEYIPVAPYINNCHVHVPSIISCPCLIFIFISHIICLSTHSSNLNQAWWLNEWAWLAWCMAYRYTLMEFCILTVVMAI